MYRITNNTKESKVCVSRTGAQNILLPGASILLDKPPKTGGFEVEEVKIPKTEVEEVKRSPFEEVGTKSDIKRRKKEE